MHGSHLRLPDPDIQAVHPGAELEDHIFQTVLRRQRHTVRAAGVPERGSLHQPASFHGSVPALRELRRIIPFELHGSDRHSTEHFKKQSDTPAEPFQAGSRGVVQ